MIRAVQMDNLRGLLSIRRVDRVPNLQIKELCRVMKKCLKVSPNNNNNLL